MDDLIARFQNLDMDQIPVYLLKTESNPTDAYKTHFATLADPSAQASSSPTPFQPVFVPVLQHRFRDDALRALRRHAERFAFAGGSPATARQKACNNAAKKFGGLVFTSQRAVDAFALVVEKLDPGRRLFDPLMPVYVVGSATAKAVRALNLGCEVVGEESGSGDVLAEFILGHHAGVGREATWLEGRKLPVLFLVGEQRRDVIPKTLQDEERLGPEERIAVQELVVYETGEMATFEEDFVELLKAARSKVREQWIVVFSPQGCEAMLSALGWLDEKTGKFSPEQREVMSGSIRTRIATIGPTTRDFLVDELGFEPDVCAAKPSPEGLSEAILAAGK